LGGVFAPRPMCGPHKLRESLPLILFLRNRLKYALSYNEARMICKQRAIKVDGKVRTEMRFPAGFMGVFCSQFSYFYSIPLFTTLSYYIVLDVIRIDKTDETFRMVPFIVLNELT
jgi:ribosomal protein S4E